MKKIFLFFFVLMFSFGVVDFALADELTINFFYSSSCPACAKEKPELESFVREVSGVKLIEYEISENSDLIIQLYEDYEVPRDYWGFVPTVFVGEKYFIGYDVENIKSYVSGLIEGSSEESVEEQTVELPIIGKISVGDYSLPVLAVLLGALDGFNVCSLGALILILSLVLALKSRKKILLFGGIFILTTSLVYGLFIVIWHEIFRVLTPHLRSLQFVIGTLAVIGGFYFLKEFIKFRKQGPTCEMGTGKKIMASFSKRFEKSIEGSKGIVFILGSILLFAAIITIVEFPCSGAVPLVFAGVLANAGLSTFHYLLYIALFVLFYMLDEIIVFLIALFTMTVWLSSSKTVTWIALIEAIVLFSLGFYYLITLI